MKTYLLNSAVIPAVSLEGEANAVRVSVRCGEWAEQFPQGAGILLFQRPDGEVYPLTTVFEPPYLYAVLTGAETAVPGLCRVEAQWRATCDADETVIAKAGPYRLRIVSSLTGAGLPTPAPTWTDTVLENAQAAAQSAAQAQEILSSIPQDYSSLAARVAENEAVHITDAGKLPFAVGKNLNTTQGTPLGKLAAQNSYIAMTEFIWARAGSVIDVTDNDTYQFQVARYEKTGEGTDQDAFTCTGMKAVAARGPYTVSGDCYVRFSIKRADDAAPADDSMKQFLTLDIRSEKVNEAVADLQPRLAKNTADIAENAARIAANAQQIALNTAAGSANAGTIAEVTGSGNYVRGAGSGMAINSATYHSKLPDLDGAPVNQIYFINGCLQSITHIPSGETSGSAVLVTLAPYVNASQTCAQILYVRGGNVWYRTRWTGAWSGWSQQLADPDSGLYQRGAGSGTLVNANTFADNLPDLNGAVLNRTYFINACLQFLANRPEKETANSAVLVTFAAYRAASQSQAQVLLAGNGYIWHRIQLTGTWGAWKLLNDDRYDSEKYSLHTCVDRTKTKLSPGDKFLVFGDSISRRGWAAQFASITGAAEVNKGVEGAVFGHTHSDRPEEKWVSTQIAGTSAAEWAGAKLVIVAAGTNDAGWNIAPSEVRLQAEAVIDAIAEAAPDAHILFITPIRRGDGISVSRRLAAVAGAIGHAALCKGCSVINGFDIPIPMEEEDGVIDDLSEVVNSSHDHLHPNAAGRKIYAGTVAGLTQDSNNDEAAQLKADMDRIAITDEASGSVASFPDGSGLHAKSCVIGIEPVQAGSGDPSPDNVRPITGWTGAQVGVAGKNLFPLPVNPVTKHGITIESTDQGEIWIHGTSTLQSGYSDIYLGTYVPSFVDGKIATLSINEKMDGIGIIMGGVNGALNFTMTDTVTSKTGEYAAGTRRLQINVGSDVGTIDKKFKIQLELGSSATAFEPYQGHAYDISWQSEAGTVYGGTLDVVSGELTVDRAFVTLDGSDDETWYWSNGNDLMDGVVPGGIIINGATQYNVYTKNNLFTDTSWTGRSTVDGSVGMFYGASRVFVKYSGITDLASGKAFLQSHPLQVVYQLAMPQVYHLTTQEVETLAGLNRVWADTGDTSVKYIADPKAYIDKRLAAIAGGGE